MPRTQADRLQKQVDEFNERPLGSEVVYWPMRPEGKTMRQVPARRTVTRRDAFVLSGHTACVFLEGISGCVGLDFVRFRDQVDEGVQAWEEGFAHVWEVAAPQAMETAAASE